MPVSETMSTLLSSVLSGEPGHVRPPWSRLWFEGFAYTGIGLAITNLWAIEQAGVFSIFLASAALSSRLNYLLEENREAIWVHKISGWDANRLTASSVLALFFGITTAFVVATVLLGPTGVDSSFGFALDAAGIGMDSILTRRFGTVLGLLGHNSIVLLSFVALAFVYRSYGALLALTWNAAIWGVVLTLLVARGLEATSVSPLVFVLVSLAAVLPHLFLEALAYVVASLAAIFVSRAITKYHVNDPRVPRVLAASLALIGAGMIALIVAAGTEHALAPALLRAIR